jgi:hypothetical protein
MNPLKIIGAPIWIVAYIFLLLGAACLAIYATPRALRGRW